MTAQSVARKLGHGFSDEALLRTALTHRSFGTPNNERLEFLGDSIVNLIVAEALFARWPKADEGALTRARAGQQRPEAPRHMAGRVVIGQQVGHGWAF